MAKVTYKYEPIERYRKNPVHTHRDGKLIGIGGDSIIPRQPPKDPIQVKEATQDEYKILYETGLDHIIRKVKVEPKDADVQTEKPASEKSEG